MANTGPINAERCLPRINSTQTEALQAVLSEVLGSRIEIHSAKKVAGGISRATWQLQVQIADGTKIELIAQLGGRAGLVEPVDQDVERALLDRLQPTRVPVPRVVHSDSTTQLLGTPFVITEMLPGETSRTWIAGLEASARAEIGRECARTLGAIQEVDCSGLNLPRRSTEEWCSYWGQMVSESLREPRPILSYALKWLLEHQPRSSMTKLVHGDYRVGNLLCKPDSLVGVLDWELSHIGDPLEDLAWVRLPAWRLLGDDCVGGLLPESDFLSEYEMTTGREVPIDDLTFWDVFANMKLAAISARAYRLFQEGESDSLHYLYLGRRMAQQERAIAQILRGDSHVA